MAPQIAHSVVISPHRAGLYETARDLAQAEREAGWDARLCDPTKPHQGQDRGVPIEQNWFNQAEIMVNHSGLSGEMNKLNKPVIHVLHGRPYSTFLLEQSGKIAVYSYWRKIAGDPRFKAFVTFWPEFLPYFANVLPSEKLYAIPAPVDLDAWTPDGPSGYGFHGHGGEKNIVITDVWREDKDPYHVINAALHYARNYDRHIKVHIFAAPQKGTAWGVLKAVLREAGILGEAVGFVKGLANVYRAADVMITPHRMATRSVREALACGCNVVMAPGNDYTPFQADPEDMSGYAAAIDEALETRRAEENRQTAERYFDSQQTAAKFIDILNEVI